ncbi:hypothetical protein KKF91_07085 [Myxococcota bacterium]|nr:hypothetical protein [Myxococcota bacterium]MBU1430316.1 hypothetical protein [Myxococcota bacterium]MBU1900600.1 hypothetical protein [Myxococcota bacterium]
MNVLGISCDFHDAAAALVVDGRVVAASEEERFTRRKHDASFPTHAAQGCLRQAGLTAADLDLVCFYEKPLLKLERALVMGAAFGAEARLTRQLTEIMAGRLDIPGALKAALGYTGRVQYTEHHLAHAASAYYGAGWERAAVLTIDGVGEWATTGLYLGEGRDLHKLNEIRYPHSLGLFYSTMTAYLGFKVNNDEYKVMGLASYGQPRYIEALSELIELYEDGSVRLNLDYFEFHLNSERMYSDKLIERFGPPRVPESEIHDLHRDLAASTQEILERGVLGMARAAHARVGGEALCMAGGVALNCVANARLQREGPFKHIWVQPAAGDGGGALGAALYAWHHAVSAEESAARRAEGARYSTLLGPSWSDEEIRAVLDAEGADYTPLEGEALYTRTAALLAEDQIIGWYQGRMEYGPRALGNRSILANPMNPEMKDILNARVKFREDFRPFAPAVRVEDVGAWFEGGESPFMLFAPAVKPGVGARLPSITHVDGTARVQTVHPEDNPRFHRLLSVWGERTGVPVLINTSFNVRGEPIVCSPADAYRCFLRTDIDFLVMGRFLVEKDA